MGLIPENGIWSNELKTTILKNNRIRNTGLIHTLQRIGLASLAIILLVHLSCVNKGSKDKDEIGQIFQRIAVHNFNPLNEDLSLTLDHTLKKAGIPDLEDEDWRVRLLGVRDLVRAGQNSTSL